MEWWVDKVIPEIQELILQKKGLLAERDTVEKSVKNGYNFFTSLKSNLNQDSVKAGIARMLELISELNEIDRKINDIDVIMVSKLEMYLGNFTARARIPEHLNDAGDLIKHDSIYLVPFKSGDENLVEVTPDDVWFLKMIKEALNARNITFEKKGLG